MYGLTTTMLARPCRSALSLVSRWTPARPQSTSVANPPTESSPPPTNDGPLDLTVASSSLSSAAPAAAAFPDEPTFASTIIHGRAALPAFYHPRTHNIPVALLHFRSYHLPLLNLFLHFSAHAAAALGIPITKPASLPTERRLWTVPKGPFVHKKAQENFERKTHKRVVKVYDANQEVVERWVKYLEHHALAGVGMRVVRWHRAPVGVGMKTVEAVKRQMRGEMTSAEKVKMLGEKIVKEETAAQAAASAAKEAARTITTQKS